MKFRSGSRKNWTDNSTKIIGDQSTSAQTSTNSTTVMPAAPVSSPTYDQQIMPVPDQTAPIPPPPIDIVNPNPDLNTIQPISTDPTPPPPPSGDITSPPVNSLDPGDLYKIPTPVNPDPVPVPPSAGPLQRSDPPDQSIYSETGSSPSPTPPPPDQTTVTNVNSDLTNSNFVSEGEIPTVGADSVPALPEQPSGQTPTDPMADAPTWGVNIPTTYIPPVKRQAFHSHLPRIVEPGYSVITPADPTASIQPSDQPPADNGVIIDGYTPGTEPTGDTGIPPSDSSLPAQPSGEPVLDTGVIIDGYTPGTTPESINTYVPSNMSKHDRLMDNSGAWLMGRAKRPTGTDLPDQPSDQPPADNGVIIDGYTPGTFDPGPAVVPIGQGSGGGDSGTVSDGPNQPSSQPPADNGTIIDGYTPGTEPTGDTGIPDQPNDQPPADTGVIIDGYTPGTEPTGDTGIPDQPSDQPPADNGTIIDGYTPGTEPTGDTGIPDQPNDQPPADTGVIIDGYTPGTEPTGDTGIPDQPSDQPPADNGTIIDGYTPGTESGGGTTTPETTFDPNIGAGGGDYSVVSPPSDLDILSAKLDENARVLMDKYGMSWEQARAQAEVDFNNWVEMQKVAGDNTPSAGAVPVMQSNLDIAIQQRDQIQNQINAVYDQGGTPSPELQLDLALANNAIDLIRQNGSLTWEEARNQAGIDFNNWVNSQGGSGDPNSNPMAAPDIPAGFDPSGLNFG